MGRLHASDGRCRREERKLLSGCQLAYRLAKQVPSLQSLVTGIVSALQQIQNLLHIERKNTGSVVQCLSIPYQSCICLIRPADVTVGYCKII